LLWSVRVVAPPPTRPCAHALTPDPSIARTVIGAIGPSVVSQAVMERKPAAVSASFSVSIVFR